MINISSMMKQYNIVQNVKEARIGGWSNVFQQFRIQYHRYSEQTLQEREIFSDLFFSYCLESIDIAGESKRLWKIIEQWHFYRKMPSRCGHLSSEQQLAILYFCENLREKLHLYFSQTSLGEIAPLTDKQQAVMIAVWRDIFLNAFSPLNLKIDSKKTDTIGEAILADTKAYWYPKIILASMYAPFSMDVIAIDVAKLWTLPSIPMWCKVVIICWLVSTPYFNSQEKHRKKILHYCCEFCQAAMQHPQLMSRGSFITFTEGIMAGLWRTAYIGGNNVKEISIFGDFIHFFMKKYHPQYGQVEFCSKNTHENKKIRIGYISRNFGSQAVSYYMVNRLIHHDKNKFEIYTFAVGDRNDQMTKIVKENSGKFIRFNNLNNLDFMANSIIDSNLDILIYADIGMDPVTNMLAGLQLAPVQCALVGHGTTTGLPTIQYYISGDFEPLDGDTHYREKLIRLPNLGAAQYPQEKTRNDISREKLNIPTDAVVFISCANGIKHGPARNQLLIEILQKSPNAWIVLKPFQNPTSVNHLFTERIMQAARVAGVSKRLLILPPLPQAKDIMGLLSIADIQLDTYPYGGWTTNMEALYMGLPIVTQEGNLMRNRWGAHMLRALGIQEGIAQSEAEYVAWAVEMVRDKELRLRLQSRIKTRVMDVLFNGPAAQLPYEKALLDIVGCEVRNSCAEVTGEDLSNVPIEGNLKLSETSYNMLKNEVEQAFLQVRHYDLLDIRAFMKIFEPIFKRYGFRNEHLEKVSEAKNILVLRLDEIGDVVLTTAFLRELRSGYPSANITLVVKPQVYDMVEVCPYVDQVLTFDWQKKQGQTMRDIFLNIESLCREWLWAKKFDLCILPRYDCDTYFSTFIGYLSGAKIRIGYSEQATGNKRRINKGYDSLLTHVIPGGEVKHEVERSLDVLRFVGYEIIDNKLELWTDQQDEEFAENALGKCQQLKVAFAPGIEPNRRVWPIERYIELSHWLKERYNAKIIILGGPGEESSGMKIMEALPEATLNLIGKTTLRQTAAILKECDIYIGRNTGIMHMAAAANKPVIEISCLPRFGDPNDMVSPSRFGPWGVPAITLQPQQFLSPCRGTCYQQEAHCILGVTTEGVKKAVEMILAQ